MFNVKIEWVKDDAAYNPQTFIANVLAGDPVADIQVLCREEPSPNCSRRLLVPLDDILTEGIWKTFRMFIRRWSIGNMVILTMVSRWWMLPAGVCTGTRVCLSGKACGSL